METNSRVDLLASEFPDLDDRNLDLAQHAARRLAVGKAGQDDRRRRPGKGGAHEILLFPFVIFRVPQNDLQSLLAQSGLHGGHGFRKEGIADGWDDDADRPR